MKNGQQTSQNDPRQVRESNRASRSESEPGGEERVGTDGSTSRGIGERVDRTVGEGGAFTVVIGGIYSQLIQQAERRLGNAVACIEWYERERNEAMEELTQLKEKLALLAIQEELGLSATEEEP